MEPAVKPKLNSTVYVLFNRCSRYRVCLNKEKVIAKGNDIFFHSGSLKDDVLDEYKLPLKYSDYGKIWFKTFKEAKEKVGKLYKFTDDYWEII